MMPGDLQQFKVVQSGSRWYQVFQDGTRHSEGGAAELSPVGTMWHRVVQVHHLKWLKLL